MVGEEEKQEGKGLAVQDRPGFAETGTREVSEEEGFTMPGGTESSESQSKTHTRRTS
jgi:hypothetical protein